MVRTEDKKQVTKSRSCHQCTTIETVHRLMIMKLKASLVIYRPSRPRTERNLGKISRETKRRRTSRKNAEKKLANFSGKNNDPEHAPLIYVRACVLNGAAW